MIFIDHIIPERFINLKFLEQPNRILHNSLISKNKVEKFFKVKFLELV